MRTRFLLALVAVVSMGSALLFGAAGLKPEPQSAEASGWFGWSVAIRGAPAQDGQEQQAPTPVSTVVRPGIVTVVPERTVVVPIQSAAEAQTGTAGQGLAENESGGNLFTGVRGGLIGAGIGLGAVLALALAVSAARRAFTSFRQ